MGLNRPKQENLLGPAAWPAAFLFM